MDHRTVESRAAEGVRAIDVHLLVAVQKQHPCHRVLVEDQRFHKSRPVGRLILGVDVDTFLQGSLNLFQVSV